MATYSIDEVLKSPAKKTYSIDEVKASSNDDNSFSNIIPNALSNTLKIGKYIAGSIVPSIAYNSNDIENAKSLGYGALNSGVNIGATIEQPFDALYDKITGNKNTNKISRENAANNFANMTDTNSNYYKGGKLLTDIAITAPIGGGLGAIASKIPQLAKYAPLLASGGFSLGDAATGSKVANTLLRGTGGAVTGATAGGLIDPSNIGTSAIIGAAIPTTVQGAYGVAKAVGSAAKPLYKAGRESIIGQKLTDLLGDDASNVADTLSSARGNTEGFIPSVGQASNNAELATMERMLKERSPALFQKGIDAQRKALATAANSLGGDDLTRVGLLNDRNSAVEQLYDIGKNAMVESTPQLEELLKRPIINQAYNSATTNSMNRGKSSLIDDKIINGTLYQDDAPKVINQFSRPDLMKGEIISGGKYENVIQQIRKMGGANISHLRDITGETSGAKARAPVGFFNKNGLGIDDIAQQLDELHYIPKDEMKFDGGVRYVKDAIRQHLGGGDRSFALDDAIMRGPDYYGTKTTDFINEPRSTGVGDYSVNNVYSGKTLQEIKFALDAAKKFNPSANIGERMTQGGILDASTDFNNYLSDVVPEMRKADNIYRSMSKPINQLDLGNEIRDRFIPAKYRDDAAPARLMRDNLAKIYRDTGNTLAQKVTGFKGATLNNTLSPQQYNTFGNIVNDNKFIDAGIDLGKGGGSQTFQHLAFNSKAEQNGLTDKLIGLAQLSTPVKIATNMRDMLYSAPNKKLEAQFANILQDPEKAASLIRERLSVQGKSNKQINTIINKYNLLNAPAAYSSINQDH